MTTRLSLTNGTLRRTQVLLAAMVCTLLGADPRITLLAQTTKSAENRDIKLNRDQGPKEFAIRSEVVKSWPSPSKRWAFVAGVNQYADKQVTPLLGAANDAKALAEALIRFAGFPRDQVILLTSDEPEERKPTKGNIFQRLSNVVGAVPKDGLFLFSFAGHGIERNSQAYLLPSDARVTENIRVLQATALSVIEVKDLIKEAGVKQVVVLLDACRNDPTAGRGEAPNPLTEAYRRGFSFDLRNHEVEAFVTIYATKVGYRAYEYVEQKHGYFTWALLEGLKGGAANDKGEVTLTGLISYIQETVPKRIRIDLGQGKDQRPFADMDGYKAGELVIAKVKPGTPPIPGSDDLRSTESSKNLEWEEWVRINSSRDLTVLAEYRKKYPDGAYAEEALRRMEKLEWEAVKTSKDLAVLQAFLKKYPNGEYGEQATSEIQKAQSQQTSSVAVLEVIKHLQEAYQSQDLEKLISLWPAAKKNIRAYEQFFKIARSIKFELQPEADPQIEGDGALVRCRRRIQISDERGPQKPREDSVTVRLRKVGSDWVIDSM